ncbi:MAG: M23 family metallopeptidase [Gammaproteobacteria bacterium]|nr:M23 family metallopeptidase [Gammaproteobacteria bacterium]
MKLILLTRSSATARHIQISLPAIALCSVLSIVSLIGASVFLFSDRADVSQSAEGIEALKADLVAQQGELTELRGRAQQQLDALALRMGALNASAIRVNALGKRLTDMADLQDGEFDFDSEPALGGPLEQAPTPAVGQMTDFFADIDSMDRTLYSQEQQLLVLESLMLNRKLHDRVYPSGRPVKAGYISSYYGKRKDPLHGKTAYHKGVDFAGKRGGDIVAVAGGVVTYSGKRSGYGNLVEINHGSGYVTRYAHNDQNLVAVGDQIQPGQKIALIGSTGRATGPHVHFEVWHRGRPVDPVRYIRQKT